MDEIKQIALKIKRLEECGELRVVYEDIGSNAMVMTNSDRFVIILNPALSYEQQIREIWHEAKHIYSHLDNNSYNVALAEYEADKFVDEVILKPEFFNVLRGATVF